MYHRFTVRFYSEPATEIYSVNYFSLCGREANEQVAQEASAKSVCGYPIQYLDLFESGVMRLEQGFEKSGVR